MIACSGIASIYRNYNGIIDLRSFSIDESTLVVAWPWYWPEGSHDGPQPKAGGHFG